MSDQPPNSETVEGIVTARLCECCSHHEIGIVSATGEYIALKQGMQVRIIGQADQQTDDSSV